MIIRGAKKVFLKLGKKKRKKVIKKKEVRNQSKSPI